MLQVGAERLPKSWFLLQTKLSNQISIRLIGLIEVQLAFSIAFDASWIDHTDVMTLPVKILAYFISILPGGFQTNMDSVYMTRDQPLIHCFQTSRIVANDLV